MLARLTISYFFYVSKTIPSNREYRELNEVRENSIAKLPNFSNLTKKKPMANGFFSFLFCELLPLSRRNNFKG